MPVKSPTPEYRAWLAMRERCFNPRGQSFKDYGARGIRVCRRWDSFINFLSDMGPRPGKTYTLERKNNNRGYTPKNCVWATRAQQARNRRSTKLNSQRVDRILQHVSSGATYTATALKFRVTRQMVSLIAKGLSWK